MVFVATMCVQSTEVVEEEDERGVGRTGRAAFAIERAMIECGQLIFEAIDYVSVISGQDASSWGWLFQVQWLLRR